MRNWLTVAAVVVFAVSTGLLEMVHGTSRPTTVLPSVMSGFEPAADEAVQPVVDDIVTSGIER